MTPNHRRIPLLIPRGDPAPAAPGPDRPTRLPDDPGGQGGSYPRRGRPTAAAAVLTMAAGLLSGCGGEPPEGFDGFELGMPQTDVMAEAGSRGFTCHLQATRPKLTTCSGNTSQGALEVQVVGDRTEQLTLRPDVEPGASGEMREYSEPFGTPAWRDRPYPPQSDPPERYHTLWLDEDTTRAVALICDGRELAPPCTVVLATTSPSRILAKLDTLLGIRR
jgi:hypothetical protein